MATWASLESPRRALLHATPSFCLRVLYVVVCSNMCARIPPTSEKLPKCLLTRSRHRHVIVTTRRAAKMRRRSEKWGGRWRADIRGRKRPPRGAPLTRPRRVQPRPQNVPWSTIEGGAAHTGSTALVSRAAGSGRAHRMARPAPHYQGGALDTRGKIYSLPTKESR